MRVKCFDLWCKVVAALAITYCMQASGGTNTFKMTQDIGRPVSGTC